MPIEDSISTLCLRFSGASAILGDTASQTSVVSLVPGSYDVLYQRIAGAELIPANDRARVVRNAWFVQSATFDVDIPAIQLFGWFLIDGDIPPASVYDSGYVWLRSGEDSALLGSSHQLGYTRKVFPGTYDVEWELPAGGTSVPRNKRGLITSTTFSIDGLHSVEIEITRFRVDVTLDRAPFSLTPAGAAISSLRDLATGDIVPIPAINGALDGRFVAGSYALRYSHDGGSAPPINQDADLNQRLELSADVSTTIDLLARPLSGLIRLNRGPFPEQVSESGVIELRGADSTDSLLLGPTYNGDYSMIVLPGKYYARYNWYSGSAVPRNQSAPVGCVQVSR